MFCIAIVSFATQLSDYSMVNKVEIEILELEINFNKSDFFPEK